jgi:hypothetical protein
MKWTIINIIFLFLVLPFISNGQNAPVSVISDAVVCPGSSVTIPVRVTNFKNIGSMGLKIQYNTQNLSFSSWSNVSGFPGLSLNASQPGMLVIAGFTFTTGGITLPDNSTFLSLTFNYSGGNTTIAWYENGPSCEWTGAAPSFPVLNDLPTATYYINGEISPSLIPAFASTNQLPLLNEAVTLLDQSTGAASWSWNISPSGYTFVNGTSSTSQNPQVVFTGNGPYSVTLTVTNGSCVQILTRDEYIHAGTPGLWTGAYSSNWYDERNWHNWIVPDQNIDVVIPGSALFWPEFSGDFIVGTHCFNLTLQGIGSVLTVTGDFVLP